MNYVSIKVFLKCNTNYSYVVKSQNDVEEKNHTYQKICSIISSIGKQKERKIAGKAKVY